MHTHIQPGMWMALLKVQTEAAKAARVMYSRQHQLSPGMKCFPGRAQRLSCNSWS